METSQTQIRLSPRLSIPEFEPDERRTEFARRVLATDESTDPDFERALFEAFSSVPRGEFIDPQYNSQALLDVAVPIGFGQNTSKPTTLVRMLRAAKVEPDMSVLEIGSGCGYFSAILVTLGARVFSIERRGPLAQSARTRLDDLGFQTVLMRSAQGLRGWTEFAPFDRIFVSAAVEEFPERLTAQLAPQGVAVYPLIRDGSQELMRYKRNSSVEQPDIVSLGACEFVATE